MKKRIGITLITLGVLMISFSLGLVIYNQIENNRALANSSSVLDAIKDSALTATESYEYYTEESTVQVLGDDFLGTISIPGLDIELPVMASWSKEKMKKAPCRQFGTIEEDNIVIAGHNYPSIFGDLRYAYQGDKVIFTDVQGNVINYEVVEINSIDPTQVSLVRDSEFDLVLYTCNTRATKRITIFCNRV